MTVSRQSRRSWRRSGRRRVVSARASTCARALWWEWCLHYGADGAGCWVSWVLGEMGDDGWWVKEATSRTSTTSSATNVPQNVLLNANCKKNYCYYELLIEWSWCGHTGGAGRKQEEGGRRSQRNEMLLLLLLLLELLLLPLLLACYTERKRCPDWCIQWCAIRCADNNMISESFEMEEVGGTSLCDLSAL